MTIDRPGYRSDGLHRRIHVTGNAGAGKTTLASRIAAELDLPLFGLDKIVWRPGWEKTPPDIRDQLEAELIAKPRWVIDGVSHLIRQAADVTIFLDVPRHRCLIRSCRRSIPYLFRSRPELPDNCPEYRILPRLFKIVWRFPDRVRPVILNEIKAGSSIIHLSDPDEYSAAELSRRLS